MDKVNSKAQAAIIKETSTTLLEYVGGIMYLRLKEGAEFSLETTKKQYSVQDELTGTDNYGVLVDATHHVSMSKESREFMAAYINPRRKATALLTRYNLATLILANFYMKFNRPNIPTKLFNHEDEAIAWLKHMLENH
jgi:hypothetical protein